MTLKTVKWRIIQGLTEYRPSAKEKWSSYISPTCASLSIENRILVSQVHCCVYKQSTSDKLLKAMVLLSVKPDFPNDDGVGAGVVRDGLSVVASDHAGHSPGEPGQDPHDVHGIPAKHRECPS